MRRTDGRGDARETYRKHILKGALPADIIDGAKAFLRDVPEKDRPYIPLASSWMNKESYLDWCEKERAFQQRLADLAANVVPIRAPVTEYKPKFLREWESRQASVKE
ncbi:hypothetical protein LB542_19830 [Mesorhizobium sp. BR1-1-9]|uniref:hypothetical protein n=1 Tax=Mesorhizobium sp. BR1-1-9 TaxID=2876646 RepID=UPI001CD1047C|nr:hypothetical protein [Mesorhizobium sp. BR1-1-9]MBZ9873101.1 hypothetical protein [Mesorhizobium sp. BR1-1-9]